MTISSSKSNKRAFDRRQKEAKRDKKGFIKEPTYRGVDRRSGFDRRALYRKAQRQKIRKEKAKFIKRSIISGGVLFLSVVAISIFLLFPEYNKLDKFVKEAIALKAEAIKKIPANFSLSAFLNKQIKEIEDGTEAVGKVYKSVSISHGDKSVIDLANMIKRMNNMKNTVEGAAVVQHSVNNLRAVIYETANDPDRLSKVIKTAQKYDKTLNSMLGGIGTKDVAAAAMLLTMNEFRSKVYNGRPYYKDIALLKKIAGNDPEMNAAIDRLEPFAERGAMSKEALEKQFKGLAKDIIVSQVRGEDLELKNRTVNRFNNLVNTSSMSDLQGEDEMVIIARAQRMLDAGDVEASLREIGKLEGSSAVVAQPWMDNARTSVAVEQSSDVIMQGVLGTMSGNSQAHADGLMGTIKANLGERDNVIYMSPIK